MASKPLTLSFPLTFAESGDALPSRFDGVAYSGGVAWQYDPMVIDLATLTADTPMPLLYEHHRDSPIGLVKAVINSGGTLSVTGELFSGFDPDAQAIARKAQAGMPWQMSVGLFDYRSEFIPAQQRIEVNGRQFDGPVVVLRGGRVREVSVVALGADADTEVSMFTQPTHPEGAPPMSDAPTARVAELEAEVSALKTELTTLRDEKAARDATEHAAALAALMAALGKEGDEAAAPYKALTAPQLKALAADLAPVKSAAPETLFRELAAPGSKPTPFNPLVADARVRAGIKE